MKILKSTLDISTVTGWNDGRHVKNKSNPKLGCADKPSLKRKIRTKILDKRTDLSGPSKTGPLQELMPQYSKAKNLLSAPIYGALTQSGLVLKKELGPSLKSTPI